MDNAARYIPRGRIRKDKFCKMYNFSESDARKFLNVEHYNELAMHGYERNSKFITAKVMTVIIGLIGEPKELKQLKIEN